MKRRQARPVEWKEFAGVVHVDCTHKKRGYVSRNTARLALRQMLPKIAQGQSAFYCDESGYWHTGHLAPHVKRGNGQRS